MTEEIIIDKEDKTKKHRNNEIDCLHFCCRKGENDNVLFWCDFYDDHCDNYTGCYYRKYLRLEQENENLKKEVKQIGSDFIKKGDYARELEQENKDLKEKYSHVLELAKTNADSNEYCLRELEKENKAFKQSEQEAIEIIADLKHQLSLYKNSHKTEQDRRRKFENALEEIRNYCDRIEQGSVIGTQDCLINSIKNITNEVLNESK